MVGARSVPPPAGRGCAWAHVFYDTLDPPGRCDFVHRHCGCAICPASRGSGFGPGRTYCTSLGIPQERSILCAGMVGARSVPPPASRGSGLGLGAHILRASALGIPQAGLILCTGMVGARSVPPPAGRVCAWAHVLYYTLDPPGRCDFVHRHCGCAICPASRGSGLGLGARILRASGSPRNARFCAQAWWVSDLSRLPRVGFRPGQ